MVVLDPVRTLVEKLMILHDAAVDSDKERRRATARHYYDIDALLRNPSILSELERHRADVLAREIAQHSKSIGLSSTDRPRDGFASSPAWEAGPRWLVQAYDDVMSRLVWENSPKATFEQCCERVHQHAALL